MRCSLWKKQLNPLHPPFTKGDEKAVLLFKKPACKLGEVVDLYPGNSCVISHHPVPEFSGPPLLAEEGEIVKEESWLSSF